MLCPIPILLYHRIDYRGDGLSVTPKQFENHLVMLKKMGFATIFLDELLAFRVQALAGQRKYVALTIDDGHVSGWIYAYPLLKKYNQKATFFITTSRITHRKKRPRLEAIEDTTICRPQSRTLAQEKNKRGEDFLCWEELKEMEAAGVADIQPHGHRHIFIKGNDIYLEGKPIEGTAEEKNSSIREELLLSKTTIEQELQKTCRHFAWPGGGYTPEAIAIAEKCGFETISTIELGSNDARTGRYCLRRITIKKWFAPRLRFLLFFLILSNNTLKKAKRYLGRALS